MKQLYAATLSNPAGAPLNVHLSLPEGIVRSEVVDRLQWMGAQVTSDEEPADMYLANAHNAITKVRASRLENDTLIKTQNRSK